MGVIPAGGPRAGAGRVIHVVDVFEPRVGGIETQVRDLADRQARAGLEVHVLTATAGAPGVSKSTGEPTGSPSAPTSAGASVSSRDDRYRGVEWRPSGVRVHRLASRWTLGVPVHPRDRSLLSATLRALTGGLGPQPAADITVHIHAGAVSPFAYAGLEVATEQRLATVVTWHSLPGTLARAVRQGGARARGPFVATAVSSLAAEAVLDALGPHGSKRAVDGRVGVIPNGIDTAAWQTAAADARHLVEITGRGGESGSLRLAATQRLAPRKRARELVATVLAVDERAGRRRSGAPRLTLTIAGGGRDASALENLIGDRDDVVRLLGPVERRDLPTLYAQRDVFVAPARLESFGIAALEARASGLPVLTPAGSGPAEFIADRVDGRIARPVDRRAVLRWKRYGRHVDPDLAEILHAWATGAEEWRTLAREARRRPVRAGWDATLAACESAYAAAGQALTEE